VIARSSDFHKAALAVSSEARRSWAEYVWGNILISRHGYPLPVCMRAQKRPNHTSQHCRRSHKAHGAKTPRSPRSPKNTREIIGHIEQFQCAFLTEMQQKLVAFFRAVANFAAEIVLILSPTQHGTIAENFASHMVHHNTWIHITLSFNFADAIFVQVDVSAHFKYDAANLVRVTGAPRTSSSRSIPSNLTLAAGGFGLLS